VAAVVLAVPAAALADTYMATSSGPITIPRVVGNASPYPSTINVPSTATIQNVRVTLNNGRELDRPDSIDIALTHGGTTVMIISDAGDTAAQPGPVSTIFDKNGTDFSATACDTGGQAQWPSGATPYKPINCAAQGPADVCFTEGADNFPAPGPGMVPSGAGNLGAFDLGNQQGDWNLWIVTDCDHNAGFPALNQFDSWTLTITNGGTTAVKLVDFGAKPASSAVVLRWRTANESGVAGYNVWRVAPGKAVKVNRSLVAAHAAGRAGGASYRLVDRFSAHTPATYRLQAVTVSGKRSWLATTSLSPLG
jgi:hypothetical protein